MSNIFINPETGKCQPLRPPHRPQPTCDGCNNASPNGESWDEYDRSLRERVTLLRLDEKRSKINELTFRLIEALGA